MLSRAGGTMRRGPRIYNLFPLLVGPVTAWAEHLERIAEMDFDWLFINPFHYPGFSGSLYAVKDYRRLNPLFRGDSSRNDDELLAAFFGEAKKHGLAIMMDLVINHTAKDSDLAARHPQWFAHAPDGRLRSPQAVDPEDPTKVTVWGDLAEIDYVKRPEREEIIAYWQDIACHYAELGVRGFRGDAAYKVPASVWREIIGAVRAVRPDAIFFAETLGCRPDEVMALRDAGFDFIFNSSKWWDFKARWLIEQYETYRHIAPSIAFPESHDTARLATELAEEGMTDHHAIEAIYRQRYLFAAVFSTGILMPMGYEFGFRRRLDVVRTRPTDWEEAQFDLSSFIAETNRMKAALPPLNEEGRQIWSTPDDGDSQPLALLRTGGKDDWALAVVNPDVKRPHTLATDKLIALGAAPPGIERTPESPPTRLVPHAQLRLEPSELRIFTHTPVVAAGSAVTEVSERETEIRTARIVIQNVAPELDCGRYAVKREVGDLLLVSAEVFREGHDKIRAVLRHRRADEDSWHETSMELINVGLDLWQAGLRLEENARYQYTVEAWPDDYESWRDEIEKKQAANQVITLELAEGRAIVDAAMARANAVGTKRLRRTLDDFDHAETDVERVAILTAPAVRTLVGQFPDRSRAIRYAHVLEVVVDRPKARFAAWYEMFPRSQGTDPTRSATFSDCITRLEDIQSMGFDVVYLVPIHPIGRTHRKGPNNTLNARDTDPGSPYAIGAAEGGHDSIHPDLGTIEEFRRFVDATKVRGMEVAMDLAVQCAPDHPWLTTHPDWFQYRPDGSIKHAENPPKKYQDIVNLNFDGTHRDALWRAFRDVVLFWIEQGVHIFRVDNPHTKPFPFWEWLIRDIQHRHPETIFLAEAFTRPTVLKMLAKIGFSQSYTYFTWRNFKGELTEYLTELTNSDAAEYLRPNFFTNTPDILPPFLQTGGRPAFMIRLVLAATLSSVYGIYNGFELCEATAVPGTEEYRDSEKYQYKVWDWDRPGNIKTYVAAVNRIRRDNAALHHFRNLEFYHAADDNVMFYGKRAPESDGSAHESLILIAVNLDPYEAHETEIEVPLGEIGIAPDAPYEVEELLSGRRHLWRGPYQKLRLHPENNPAAILRLTAAEQVAYREPCF